jgi:membrane carboxypeptidase/penicillin-binding protein
MAIVPTRVAQVAIRILVLLGCLAALLVAIVVGWLTFYTSDLPDIRPLSSFAPEVPAVVDAYICNKKTTVKAIQTTQMTDVRNALLASEGDVDQRSTVRRLHAYFLDRPEGREGYGKYSFEVSRQLFCNDHRKVLKLELAELRTAIQLERHFSSSQLLDIYLNRAYFGPGVYGIENAAEYYVEKPANQLSIAEAALLVGLIKSPRWFSPLAHPDNVLMRRNEVIDRMATRGSISPEQASKAKSMPLGTATDGHRPQL